MFQARPEETNNQGAEVLWGPSCPAAQTSQVLGISQFNAHHEIVEPGKARA